MKNLYRVKAWTGPCCVKHHADKLRAAGVNVTCEGTEHVYAEVESENRHAAIDIVRKIMHGNDELASMSMSADEVSHE